MTRNFEKQFIECFLVLMLPGPHVKSSLLMTWDESELVKSQGQGSLLRGNAIWSDMPRDIVPEINDSDPMCTTDLFQNKYLVVMSSSWNFPAPAVPSYEGSEPSRVELGHFNFRAETELTICISISSKF